MRRIIGGALSGALVISIIVLAAGSGPATASQVTFTKDVAPILQKNCMSCHRPGEIAPMSLLSYKEVRPWAKSIRERVLDRTMPPWSADPNHGEFKNDPRLSQQEIDTIVKWVDGGSVKGDDKDMPPNPKYPEGWSIGTPDAVISMQEEHQVPADGEVPYLYFSMPTNFTEDKWVQALEIRPGNRAVVHHVIAFAQEPDTSGKVDGSGGEFRRGRTQLGGITPNKTGVTFEPGVAKLIKKGSNIVFQMHYTTNGQAATDRTSIAFIFARQPATRILHTGNAINTRFVIPAGHPNYEVTASKTFDEDVHITGFMPHMHVRGKDFTYTAVYPDGRREILLSVPAYDFNWQLSYELKKPKAMPKGTKLECVAHFDNSTKNKFNPDPTKPVAWGDQTWEEMMIGWFSYTRDAETIKTPVSASSSGQ
ncbi:MAG: thiol-disulfide isomerase [Acidobacteriota bacterium]|nr:MAG: thiol-disulfide isomerase [Acidobacteriota bacterium]